MSDALQVELAYQILLLRFPRAEITGMCHYAGFMVYWQALYQSPMPGPCQGEGEKEGAGADILTAGTWTISIQLCCA